jgi:hypothetical protein
VNISFPFWGKIRSTRKIIYSFTVAEDAPRLPGGSVQQEEELRGELS